jgi:hypothetical protein
MLSNLLHCTLGFLGSIYGVNVQENEKRSMSLADVFIPSIIALSNPGTL